MRKNCGAKADIFFDDLTFPSDTIGFLITQPMNYANDQNKMLPTDSIKAAWGERIRALSPVSERLRKWQKTHGRHGLPWQKCNADGFRDPYMVWLSEVMLQQTQVSTVVVYFDRFLERFPTIVELATASQDEVFSLWSGLGYYRRARFLHECAKIVVNLHGGVFPRSVEQLEELPGIGKTTAAAIAAFCFGSRVSIFDANVERLSSRLFAYDADLSSVRSRNVLWALAETLTPPEPSAMPWHTQALMDLGATVCKSKQAMCEACPLLDVCGVKCDVSVLPESLPRKTKKSKKTELENVWLWLESNDHVWLEPRPIEGVWGGLWSLPILEPDAARDFFDRNLLLVMSGKPFKHVLTHRNWIFYPVHVEVESTQAAQISLDPTLGQGRWVGKNEWMDLGVSGPTKQKLSCWQSDRPKKRLETAS